MGVKWFVQKQLFPSREEHFTHKQFHVLAQNMMFTWRLRILGEKLLYAHFLGSHWWSFYWECVFLFLFPWTWVRFLKHTVFNGKQLSWTAQRVWHKWVSSSFSRGPSSLKYITVCAKKNEGPTLVSSLLLKRIKCNTHAYAQGRKTGSY